MGAYHSTHFHGQMVQSFSSVKDDNCSLGIFQWFLGLNHKYRSKQNTDRSTSWLFIVLVRRLKIILADLCKLSGTGPGFSLFMNQSWASYLILHANSPKIINRRIYLLGQQINSTVHCVGRIFWNPLRILVIQLLPRLTIGSDYWTTSQCGFEAITLITS